MWNFKTLFILPKPQFPHVQNEDKDSNGLISWWGDLIKLCTKTLQLWVAPTGSRSQKENALATLI